jgi:hypothetical protein
MIFSLAMIGISLMKNTTTLLKPSKEKVAAKPPVELRCKDACGKRFYSAAIAAVVGISGWWTCALAAPITGADARVALCVEPAGPNRVVFNPFRKYGVPIKWIRGREKIDVRIGGIRYVLDVDTAIEEAMAEWSAAIPGLRFEAVTSMQQDRYTWLSAVDRSAPVLDALGAGFPPGELAVDSNPALVLFNEKFAEEGGDFDGVSDLMEFQSVDEYLIFILRLTVKHEIGHMLGFMHSPMAKEEKKRKKQKDDEQKCAFQGIYDAVGVVPGPPIMARDLRTTLRLIHQYFDRPLRVRDIQIAPQEAAVGRLVFAQQCPLPTPAATHNELRDLKYASVCPKVELVMPPLAPVDAMLLG